ncbi:MAG: ATP-binding protein, partial [Acidobacteria bacterium]|nr:ATP-binding protein [Acidobacteriota bacterium]
PVVNRVVDAFRSLATSQGVRLVCYRPARPLTALASVPSLERCVENLIGNALQALVPGTGEIQVAVLSADREVRIEVVDSGPLLPVALRGDPFAGGVSTRRGGSGLGLASVRAQIQAMGGQVEYDENQRGWTRFSIILRRST